MIELQQFAQVTPSTGPSRLERDNKRSSVNVTAQVAGRPEGTVGQEVQEAVAQMNLPDGVEYSMGGSLESQQEAFTSLGIALLMSIILVYLIMVALYDSYIYPLVVMMAVPVALIGAFLALALTMEKSEHLYDSGITDADWTGDQERDSDRRLCQPVEAGR